MTGHGVNYFIPKIRANVHTRRAHYREDTRRYADRNQIYDARVGRLEWRGWVGRGGGKSRLRPPHRRHRNCWSRGACKFSGRIASMDPYRCTQEDPFSRVRALQGKIVGGICERWWDRARWRVI